MYPVQREHVCGYGNFGELHEDLLRQFLSLGAVSASPTESICRKRRKGSWKNRNAAMLADAGYELAAAARGMGRAERSGCHPVETHPAKHRRGERKLPVFPVQRPRYDRRALFRICSGHTGA